MSNLLVCRYYVAGLDEQVPHYLGHAMRFWNQVYNWGDAGYALNRPALDRLFTKFPTQVCAGANIADPGSGNPNLAPKLFDSNLEKFANNVADPGWIFFQGCGSVFIFSGSGSRV